ncbi:hypothetical protein GJAV_G00005930 [Gymnothorax javanicus]|nr:hypothetical protein GJAV_G00005930 [Gymnothorax javanicus]
MDMLASRLLAVVLLSVVGCSSGQDVLPPGSLAGQVGGNVTFTTISSVHPQLLTVTWNFRNGTEPVTVIGSGPAGITPGPGYEGRVTVDSATGSLQLRELTLRDSGEYTVILTSNTGASLTGATTLNVYAPVANVTVSSNSTDLVEYNDSVSLICSAFGSSLFYWWHNGSINITVGERVHLSDDKKILTISSVRRSDRGPLYCTVHNVISNDASQPVFLYISFGPDNVKVTVARPKLFLTPGSNLTLPCSAQSSPPAEIKWAFNGTMLNTTGPQLMLENIQENDSGNYTCWAYNRRTLRFMSSEPILMSVIEMISRPNIIGPTKVLIAGSSSANLRCEAVGTLISRVWLKDEKPLFPGIRITFSSDNNTVSINPVQSTDNGQYQCRLINPVSMVTVSYNLTVNYGPENVVIRGFTEIEVGHTAVLSCSALSVPAATFTWTFNGHKTRVKTEDYIVANSTSADSGTYTCVAENSVTGLRISSAPHSLRVKELSSGFQLGAVLGGTLGAVGCVALVGGGSFAYIRKRKRSGTSEQHGSQDTLHRQSNGGEPELSFASIGQFNKVDGSTVELGSAKAQVTHEPGEVTLDKQESQCAGEKTN